MPKYYHLYSDRKTVKEITREKFFRLLKYERKKNNPRLCILSGSGLYFYKGRDFMYVPIVQLAIILNQIPDLKTKLTNLNK